MPRLVGNCYTSFTYLLSLLYLRISGFFVNFWIHALSDEVLVWLSACSEVQIACMWFSRCHCIPKTRNLLHHLNPDWFNLSAADLARLSCKRGP